MRTVFSRTQRGGALLILLVVLAAPTVYADDPSPFDPPQARIHPPGGLTSQARISPPTGLTSPARIHPPIGQTSPARIHPPTGSPAPAEPSWFELFAAWLAAHARISPPIG